MKKLMMSAFLAWAVTGMVIAGNVKTPKKSKAAAKKEQCCDKSKKDPNCCKESSCCN